MVNKDNTITVAELMKMLADGRITPETPITFYEDNPRGFVALELHTYKDGSKALCFFSGIEVSDCSDIVGISEVFP
jgi:hypothetical protein